MDQDDSATVRIARGPVTAMSPVRAVLLAIAAVIVGLGLSLFLGSSSAHAAERDGGDGSSGILGGASAIVGETLAGATDAAAPVTAPVTARVVDPVVATIVSPVASPIVSPVSSLASTAVQPLAPVVAPVIAHVVAPIVAPVSGILTTAVGSVGPLLGTPAVGPVLELTFTLPPNAIAGTVDASGWTAAASAAAMPAAVAVATARGILPDVALSALTRGPLGAILTSAPTPATGVLGLLFVFVTIALLSARRRLVDDDLPSSPVFETDTSPA